MRCSYRIKQFLIRVFPQGASLDYRMAQSALPEEACKLFVAMPPGEQGHAMCVLRALRRWGINSPEVAQAALLHDVGKLGGRLSLPYRAVAVALGRLAPRLLALLATRDRGSWRYPFYVHLHHAELGARRCELAGCAPLTVTLVRHHEQGLPDPPAEPALREALLALQRADEVC